VRWVTPHEGEQYLLGRRRRKGTAGQIELLRDDETRGRRDRDELGERRNDRSEATLRSALDLPGSSILGDWRKQTRRDGEVSEGVRRASEPLRN